MYVEIINDFIVVYLLLSLNPLSFMSNYGVVTLSIIGSVDLSGLNFK